MLMLCMILDLTLMLCMSECLKLLESDSDSAIAAVGPNDWKTLSVYFVSLATVLNHSAISTSSFSAARLAASTPP